MEGFGDKICKLIDENLQKFLNDGGVLHPPSDEEDIDIYQNYDNRLSENNSEDDDILAAIDTNAYKSTKKSNDDIAAKYSTLHFSNSQAVSSQKSKSKIPKSKSFNDFELESGESTQAKKKSRSNNKEYLPGFRSGPYALLIALYNNEQVYLLSLTLLHLPKKKYNLS